MNLVKACLSKQRHQLNIGKRKRTLIKIQIHQATTWTRKPLIQTTEFIKELARHHERIALDQRRQHPMLR
ncbi:hypothetical protein KR100_01590 [Synechococcus sp. KORDI-100]|nr:hypothetical protein KR100_01590 [Synechococcus sp. KORDI-100]